MAGRETYTVEAGTLVERVAREECGSHVSGGMSCPVQLCARVTAVPQFRILLVHNS